MDPQNPCRGWAGDRHLQAQQTRSRLRILGTRWLTVLAVKLQLHLAAVTQQSAMEEDISLMPPHVHHLYLMYLQVPCASAHVHEGPGHNTLMLFQETLHGVVDDMRALGWHGLRSRGKELQTQTLKAVALKDMGDRGGWHWADLI